VKTYVTRTGSADWPISNSASQENRLLVRALWIRLRDVHTGLFALAGPVRPATKTSLRSYSILYFHIQLRATVVCGSSRGHRDKRGPRVR
jgi:hypothetical protein